MPWPLLGISVQITLIQMRILDKYAKLYHFPSKTSKKEKKINSRMSRCSGTYRIKRLVSSALYRYLFQ